ncbi:MAG: hypothetical protein A2020_03895 [Lentisphaerae bacterium GWF2_45_14]|nr:MAG: hypothetical protein A2020_03895 [Lentisphaerae bacterium GWF2_45_14]
MFSDRIYSRPGGRNDASGMKCVFTLILINVLIYFFIQPNLGQFIDEFTFNSAGFRNLKLWQPLTAMFLHAGGTHLLLNMWGLYLFGSLVAPQLGALSFLEIYFVGGIAGNIFWMLFNWNSPFPLLGASGAVFGVMMVTAMLQPNLELIVFPIFIPLKVKTMVIIFIVIEIISNAKIDVIAHTAHLGGLLGAYMVVKIFHKKKIQWDPLSFIFSGAAKTRTPPGWKVNDTSKTNEDYRQRPPASPPHDDADAEDGDKVSQGQLDRILDKISKSGINSLAESEMNILRKAREQMKNNH